MTVMTQREARAVQHMAATCARPASDRAAGDILFVVGRSCEILEQYPPRPFHDVERIFTPEDVAERWASAGPAGSDDELALQIGRAAIAARLAEMQRTAATDLLAELGAKSA